MPLDEPRAVADEIFDDAAGGVDDAVDADQPAGAADDLAGDDVAVSAAEDVDDAAARHAGADDGRDLLDRVCQSETFPQVRWSEGAVRPESSPDRLRAAERPRQNPTLR